MDFSKYKHRIYGLLKSLVRIALGVYLILCLLLYFKQSSFTFYPTKDVLETPQDINLEYEDIQLKTSDKLTLSAWYIPADNARYILLFCHGNGGNISHRLENINILNNLGISCLIFDYRGYGKSEGKPSEKGVYIDAQTAYDWLIKEKNLSPENIIIYGQSLGGSIAAHLASNVKAKSAIIESTFTSYVDMGKKFYPYLPVKLFAKFKFKTIEYIKKINYPVLIIHSREDELIPFEFGQQLYKAANEPKQFMEISGSHNEGFLSSGQSYVNGLDQWFTALDSNDKGI
ncbi:MAG: alpha/beta hydrolase [Phycisphaerales bacterium]